MIYKSPIKRFDTVEQAMNKLDKYLIIRFQPNNDSNGGWGYFIREPLSTANTLVIDYYNKNYKSLVY